MGWNIPYDWMNSDLKAAITQVGKKEWRGGKVNADFWMFMWVCVFEDGVSVILV